MGFPLGVGSIISRLSREGHASISSLVCLTTHTHAAFSAFSLVCKACLSAFGIGGRGYTRGVGRGGDCGWKIGETYPKVFLTTEEMFSVGDYEYRQARWGTCGRYTRWVKWLIGYKVGVT